MSLHQRFYDNISALNLSAISSGDKAKIAVAFSGGVDSCCLLDLAVKTLGKKNITAITVDHKLRDNSSEEALKLKEICAKNQIEHQILTWDHNGVKSNVQDKARKARYKLISDYCKQNSIEHVLTGHHIDDRIENFFIRLSRGSGLFGLLNHNVSKIFDIKVVRPFFNIRKEELIEYVKENNLEWFEDETNASDKYLRNEFRKDIDIFLTKKHITKELFKKRIIQTQDNLGEFAEVIKDVFDEIYDKHVFISNEGSVVIENLSQIKHRAILRMIIEKVLSEFNPQEKKIRASSISLIIESIEHDFKKTLHGCLIINKNDELKICYEE